MIHCRRRNSTGGMDMRVRVFFLFVLGAFLVCDARQLLNSEISGDYYCGDPPCKTNGGAKSHIAWEWRMVRAYKSSSPPYTEYNAFWVYPKNKDVRAPAKSGQYCAGSTGNSINDTQIGYLDIEREVSKKDNVCTLCEEFASEALEYLAANKTQNEIIDSLHMSCSRLPSFKQQCITLVDYYAPLFFLEMTAVNPEAFCEKVNLCKQIVTISTQNRDNSCDFCHQTISELMDKLKDPDTQLEIIELLLKACNSVENYAKKCKRFVFEYGPLIITNIEKFLESTDICTALPACSSPGVEGLADS